MLAELAAANAAFAVIKTAIKNSGEIVNAGESLFKYFDAKDSLQKKSNKKGNRSDLQEFMALETLRQQEERLREEMIYAGRPGLWQDWLQFQAKAARARKEKEREEQRKRLRRIEALKTFGYWSLISFLMAAIIAIVIWFTVMFAKHR